MSALLPLGGETASKESEDETHWSKSIPSETFPRATLSMTAPRPLLHAFRKLWSAMAVSLASGVSTKISLCFQTSSRMPCKNKKREGQRQPWPRPRLIDERRTMHHVVPSGDDALHVQITWEEGNDAIRNSLRVLDEDRAKVSDDGRVVSNLEPGRDGDLIRTSGNDLLSPQESKHEFSLMFD